MSVAGRIAKEEGELPGCRAACTEPAGAAASAEVAEPRRVEPKRGGDGLLTALPRVSTVAMEEQHNAAHQHQAHRGSLQP